MTKFIKPIKKHINSYRKDGSPMFKGEIFLPGEFVNQFAIVTIITEEQAEQLAKKWGGDRKDE